MAEQIALIWSSPTVETSLVSQNFSATRGEANDLVFARDANSSRSIAGATITVRFATSDTAHTSLKVTATVSSTNFTASLTSANTTSLLARRWFFQAFDETNKELLSFGWMRLLENTDLSEGGVTPFADSYVPLTRVLTIGGVAYDLSADRTWAGVGAGALLAANNLSELTATSQTAKTNLNIGNVENTALSTWPGTINISILGTITNGRWHAAVIETAYGGTGVDNSTGGTANTFWARPNGATGAATYRAIVAADVPTLNQNTTGSAATLTTPRAINGVNFDGSAAITVTAAAGTLTGGTLAANVLATSITSTGALTGGSTGAGFTVAIGTSTITGTLPAANNTAVADAAGDTTTWPMLARSQTGSQGATTDDKLAYNATTATWQIGGGAGNIRGGVSLFSDVDGASHLIYGGDGGIYVDTSLYAAGFVGPLVGNVTGNASTASAVALGGITGFGTGVATALTINVGSAGAFIINGGALGTPSSGTLTNCTFPTLNQNTSGSAATLTTVRTIGGSNFDGSANVTSFPSPGTIGGSTPAAGTFTALTGTSGSITGLTALAVRDTSAAFDATIAATSSTALTAGRTLTIDLVNAARTLKLTGNPTLADWFDQSVKSGASPTFVTVTANLTGNVSGNVVGNVVGALSGNASTATAAAALSISGQSGLLTVTGLASTNRIKTVRDAADTILELGGSYTPTGTWTSMMFVTPTLGTPASGVLSNCTGLPASAITAGVLAADITLGENFGLVLDAALSADGKYCGITEAGTAGTTLAFGDLCYLAVADSRWELADANAASTSGDVKLGICVLAAAADGSATTMLLWGKIRADAKFPTFTVGAPVHISETPGLLVVAAPTTTDSCTRRVGFANTADELFFNPSNDYYSHT